MTRPSIVVCGILLLGPVSTAAAREAATQAAAPVAAPAQPVPGKPAAAARPSKPSAPTAQQQAQLSRQDAQMAQAAQQLMQMVDAGRIGDIWDSASPAMKRVVTREAFVEQVTADRVRLGTPDDRGPATVTRSQFAQGGKAPAGLYLNVAVPTQFSREANPIRELVSFRLDEDGTWRVSGYSLR